MPTTKTKTTSAWIQHVKNFSKANGLKYNEALKDPKLKVGYVKVERVKKSPKSPKSTMAHKKHEYSEIIMKSQSPMKVKKERKKKDVKEAPPMMIQTENGDLQQQPKKVHAKRQAKKKEHVMM